MVRDRCEASARAELLGRYPSWSMAFCTFSRVASETSGEWLMTRETVWWLTPASFATSNIEGRLLPALRLPAMPRRLSHTTVGTFAYCTRNFS